MLDIYLNVEISNFIQKKVNVILINQINLKGTLVGFDNFSNIVIKKNQVKQENCFINEIVLIRGDSLVSIEIEES
ncbi:small nucleolar ribonucleoprotein G (nucleomorph) [Guillardia theta]|uniref:Small nucleolar ribonucleoprotein G n=1 Tax=Guillardia theta TaxID=55529 RepID=Q98RT8_GUITH|nr:small nucleolar ribonucleoprotein G [Guillardia theta]AAK39860.1 small nucleolar ribonucleoprotein G [Guillardia theta]